jgi:PAS domain S-box-containing protein
MGLIVKGPLFYALVGTMFGAIGFFDFTIPLGVAVWLLYLLPIWLLSRATPFDAKLVLGGAAATTVVTTAIFFMSSSGHPDIKGTVNRGMGVSLIWIISLLLIRGRRQQLALSDSEAQFRVNFEMAAVGQAQVSAETGRFIRVNDRFCDITGFGRQELLTMTSQDLTHPDDRAIDEVGIKRLLEGHIEEYHNEKRYFRKDGDSRWVRVSARLIRDSVGRPWRTIAVVEDVTERKEAEAALMRLTMNLERRVAERTKALTDSQQRLRALTSELNLTEQRERRRLAGELHDYLAQLLVVTRMKLNRALQALSGTDLREPLAEADDVLNRSLTYTRSLVAQLLPPVLEQFGLSAALSWLGDEMQRHELAVTVQVPEERPWLSVDQEGLLFQSVRELLMNVVKHAKTEHAFLTLAQEDGMLTITVKDQGIGFDPGPALETASDKFGLFSIRERMYALGGSFRIESTPGLGTTASLELPLTESKVLSEVPLEYTLTQHRLTRSAEFQQGTSVIRVLLVDDHAMVREGLRTLLNEYPEIDVVGEAGNGEEAVDRAKYLLPNVIIMDVNMPKMDGIEATRRIMKALPGSAVIGLSVNASPHMQQVMKAAGALTLLTKESAAESLYHTIKSIHFGHLHLLDPQEPLPFSSSEA